MDLCGPEDVEGGWTGMVGLGDVVPGEVVVSAEVDPVREYSEVLGMGGFSIGGPGEVGTAMDWGLHLRKKRLFLTKIRPLWVLTKYLRYSPISVITP